MNLGPLDRSRLRAEAVRVAQANVGFGEHNPRFLPAIGAKPDYEWCAVYAGYCYRKAYEKLKLAAPAWTMRGKVPEPGAKRLVKNLGAVGRRWKPTKTGRAHHLVLPGDLVCWSRGILGWTGHVGIVTEVYHDSFVSVEGNVKQKVAVKHHTYAEPKLWRFASIEP